jgi:hypothetical protein
MSLPRDIDDITGIQHDLLEWGYARVNCAANPPEIEQGRRQLLEYLHDLPRRPGFKINLTSLTETLTRERVSGLAKVWPLQRNFGAPTELDIFHLPISWQLRQKPELYQLYSHLLGTSHLLANLDRFSLKLPGSGETEFIHIDRDPTHYDPAAGLQSMIFFGDSQFYAIPKSHTPEFHEAVAEAYQIPRRPKPRSMTMLDQKVDRDTFNLESHLETIPVHAGTLLIWSENLWHASRPNNSQRIRTALYFGYQPVDKSPNTILERRNSYLTGNLPPKYPSGNRTHLIPFRYQNFHRLILPYLAILPEEYHGTRTVRSTGKQVAWISQSRYQPIPVRGYQPPTLTPLGIQLLLGKNDIQL